MLKHYCFLSACLIGMLVAGCTTPEEELVLNNDVTSGSTLVKSSESVQKYIIVLNEDVDSKAISLETRKENVKARAYGLLKKYDIQGEIEEVYQSALKGFAVKITPGHARLLASDENIKFIEPDAIIALSPIEASSGKPVPPPPAQQVPWGITRVGGGTTTSSGTAWIIDTGIDLDHPDLKVDAARSASFLGKNSTPDDQNGHGTHCAGIVAAKDNSIGVIGVTPGATVVSVRVLDRSGKGTSSGVIAGVDYVAENGQPGDVANMSLGGGVDSALDLAVVKASEVVKFAVAAGNEHDNANNHSPARANGANIYTISAMSQGDNWASFSNFGNPPVDYCAPGMYVYSTYKDGGYATLSGTSMATPHVAGLLLLGSINSSGTVKGDPDGNPDPIAHR